MHVFSFPLLNTAGANQGKRETHNFSESFKTYLGFLAPQQNDLNLETNFCFRL